MKSFFVLFLCLITLPAAAQDDTRELLQAPKVDNFIFFSLDPLNPGKLRYEIDARNNRAAAKSLPELMTTVANTDERFNLVFEFLNPVKYSVSTSEKALDDPFYQSATEFLQSVVAHARLVQGAVQESGTPSKPQNFAIAKNNAISIDKVLFAPDLLEWWLEYFNTGKAGIFNTGKECISDEGGSFFDALQKADAQFYRGDPENNADRPANIFYKTVQDAISSMLSASTMDELTASKSSLDSAQKDLQKSNRDAELALENVRSQTEALRNQWKPDSNCDRYRWYTNGVVARFLDNTTVLLAQRKALITGLDKLLQNMDNLIKRTAGENSFIAGTVDVVSGKMKEVTLSVKERKIDYSPDKLELTVTEKEGSTGKIRVRQYSPVVLEVSAGLLYTNLTYPKFGTEEVEGQTVVAEAGKDVQRFVPVAMLNLIPKVYARSVVYPLMQIGIGTGEDRPTLAAGLGLRFVEPLNLALTGGAIWTWKKELTELNIGDPVSGTAAIEEDLTLNFQSKPRFYLGIQYSF